MKKIYLSILAATILFAACNNAPEGETAEVAEEQTVEVAAPAGDAYAVSNESIVNFYGATPTHGQNGEFPVNEGTIFVNEGKVSGGTISIKLADMLVTTDKLPDADKTKLKEHLLGEDFFDVKAEGKAEVTFTITEVADIEGNTEDMKTVSGNLSMNGRTNNITFPAKIQVADAGVTANADFVINRKDWGMMYKNDESLGDKWIYDKVKMTMNISASK